MIKRLPIVEAFLKRDHEAIQRIAEATGPDHPYHSYYQALHLMGHSYTQQSERTEVSRRVLDHPPDDRELYLALLTLSVSMMLEFAKPGAAHQLLIHARRLSDPWASSEWKAFLFNLEGAYLYTIGSDREAIDRYGMALDMLGRSRTRLWYRCLSSRCRLAITAHDFVLAESDLAELQKHPELSIGAVASLKYLTTHAWRVMGRNPEKSLAVLGPPSSAEELSTWISRADLSIDRGDYAEAGRLLEEADKNPALYPETLRLGVRSSLAYSQGDLPAARRLCRAALTATPIGRSFQMYTELLLEIELTSRRPEAARTLLGMLDADQSRLNLATHWVRLYLLEGDDAKAALHLSRRLKVNFQESIRFEFRYASEVAASQLMKIWWRAESLAKEDSPPPEPRRVKDETRDFVGTSAAMQEIRKAIDAYAPLDQTVLLTGETGTGKEVVARHLHARSHHAREPFVPVNCAAIAETLIEAELFGYVKGAFTGAEHDHEGLFVASGKGTLFLDEIGSMSLRLQAALLRALENREIRPVGSTQVRSFEARILAATSAPLEQSIANGEFRSDLYYRLKTLSIHIPPLRERPDDIAPLTRHFLRLLRVDAEIEPGEDLLEVMKRHSWPGNVRELRNEVQRMPILSGGRRILGADLWRPNPSSGEAPTPPPAGVSTRRYTRTRLEELRRLFESRQELTEIEAVNHLKCARSTVVRDLRRLETEGWIRRVRNTATGRTSCFVRSR